MKKFIAGLVIGLLLATAGISFASNETIRIFVNSQEVVPDVPPVIIDGRVMVPARFIAEPLGAVVEWDEIANTIAITSGKWKRVWPTWEEKTGKELMTYLGLKDSTPLEELGSGVQKSFSAVDDKIIHLMRIHDRLYILSFD